MDAQFYIAKKEHGIEDDEEDCMKVKQEIPVEVLLEENVDYKKQNDCKVCNNF